MLLGRYDTEAKRIRALAHILTTGVVTAFFSRFCIAGLAIAFILPIAIEAYQWIRGSHDLPDAISDFCEHFIGGLLIGGAFWFFS